MRYWIIGFAMLGLALLLSSFVLSSATSGTIGAIPWVFTPSAAQVHAAQVEAHQAQVWSQPAQFILMSLGLGMLACAALVLAGFATAFLIGAIVSGLGLLMLNFVVHQGGHYIAQWHQKHKGASHAQ